MKCLDFFFEVFRGTGTAFFVPRFILTRRVLEDCLKLTELLNYYLQLLKFNGFSHAIALINGISVSSKLTRINLNNGLGEIALGEVALGELGYHLAFTLGKY